MHQLAESIGCKVKPWLPTISDRPGNDSFSLGPDNTKFYNFSISDLEKLITPSTKMVVMNFPHNPTGAMITEGELNRIVRACEKNDCYLFNDEMYKYLEVRGQRWRSFHNASQGKRARLGEVVIPPCAGWVRELRSPPASL
ncbi:hypothetical protein TL16_g02759 [Triparma laevis f. inornata]|uniref:Aminotransferase class I/classII large domain-containing protein n=1 Tax=Triparma laevis f. inornata TaxID=1714386 RepID=A0A9W6ZW45_9STRA|nr:hypothetical protein TL16_g02759 [Triparma laevis f. inornata]